MKKTAFVFSHVHWDIEWYLPFRSFRFWLVKSLDRLIDPVAKQPGFKTFVYDGQVAPIDHYLEIKPENAAAIRQLIKSGKLSVGPFYTQYDEWLTGPEAIVRNCLYGDRRAREYGAVMKAGYLPDNFGHPAQMPQILDGFGLQSLIFMRGMPERSESVGDQFHWVGLDGTRVLGVHLRHTYCNAHAVGAKANAFWPPWFRAAAYGEYIQTPEFLHHAARETDLQKGVTDLVAAARKAEPGSHSGVIALANGFDSAVPQETIAELIALANQQQDEFEFVHGNCAELTQAIRQRNAYLQEFAGEMWGGRYQLLLTGAITTRSYLKQANFVSESLLEQYAEPLSALAALDGAAWPARQLEEAWRWLFLNQTYAGLNVIEDEADRGDAWDFSEPWLKNPVLRSPDFPATCRLVEAGPVRSMLEITTRMRVPKRLEGERRSRQTVELVLVAQVSLDRGARRVDVTLTLDNQACDHRLRLRCPTGLQSKSVTSQGHFGILTRPVRNSDEGKTGWCQPPPTTFHFREWVAVEQGKRGLAVACRGLHEYESRGGRQGIDLYITLLRGYGRMGRANLKTRGGGTSPTIPTPGAQCLGVQTFDYSFLPYAAAGPTSRAPFLPQALAFLYPPIAHQADPTHILVDESLVQRAKTGALATPAVQLQPGNLRLSAFKRAADDDGWILRFWENEGRPATARIDLAAVFTKAVETNLNEEPRRSLKIVRGRITLDVGPYKIITLKLN